MDAYEYIFKCSKSDHNQLQLFFLCPSTKVINVSQSISNSGSFYIAVVSVLEIEMMKNYKTQQPM
jgi:hypothetical protein